MDAVGVGPGSGWHLRLVVQVDRPTSASLADFHPDVGAVLCRLPEAEQLEEVLGVLQLEQPQGDAVQPAHSMTGVLNAVPRPGLAVVGRPDDLQAEATGVLELDDPLAKALGDGIDGGAVVLEPVVPPIDGILRDAECGPG